MGLEALFDEPKKKVEKTNYEKGKRFCCHHVCAAINRGIEAFTNEIDEIQYERVFSERKIEEERKAIHDNKVGIKTLSSLRREIMRREPNCKCY